MRIVVDYGKCISSGWCTLESRDVFQQDEDGTLRVVTPHPPEALHEQVRKAVQGCPVKALSIEE